MDGGSFDATVDVIRKYDEYLSYWESAPDNGIYHALNKGLTHAADGSYVLVLGADDRLLNLVDVVEAISQYNPDRSEEHTSELQSLMRISYAVFCLKKKNKTTN